mmetsp:Transcript_235/g.535  ORF Transcript_235/g.535 Transcript_235/m.535 type:complete len:675 (+) Transcript_235:214-2238(+)|eukprot:CAMPEP_0206432814 /NCGR_PEP_ID=MMETSP0324_2-20121206/8176_1 /ASSEMBLY_ACC=CAM_ASM_000836 /TAXON_ID=2866 /ORGANISM="Crypthecodinium cohnii, Strain Seligo" /LENGTH=674 /DNA_ID=CAMNT_0053898989 /DNA_START=154 /DNA_END=2178 /DNA_ORIENTATION=-
MGRCLQLLCALAPFGAAVAVAVDIADANATECPKGSLDCESDVADVELIQRTLSKSVLHQSPNGAKVEKDEKVLEVAKRLFDAANKRAKATVEQMKKDGIDYDVPSHEALPRDFGVSSSVTGQSTPPTNIKRDQSQYSHCSCGEGSVVKFWITDKSSTHIAVPASEMYFVKFGEDISSLSFQCSGSDSITKVSFTVKASQWLSLQVIKNTDDEDCSTYTPELKWNSWDDTDYLSSVPFTTGTEGYSCFKIPAVLHTSNGTWIAFSEARKPDCSDYAETDMVYKRSTDGGKTWGPLQLLVDPPEDVRQSSGLCGHPLVIGNIAPVQLRADSAKHPGRILVPYTRNNYEHWIVYSDDDGQTFVGDARIPNAENIAPKPDCNRNMSYFGYDIDKFDFWNVDDYVSFVHLLCSMKDPYSHFANLLTGPWQWVGAGPPGSLQTKSGRILVPSYHSYIRGLEGDGVLPISQLYNNFALGHVLISDDGGDTWTMSDDWQVGNGANENQMVQLANGSILTYSRALATGSTQQRLQALSNDEGKSFGPSYFVDMPQSFNGCQGSTVTGETLETIYSATPDPGYPSSLLQSIASLIGCGGTFNGRKKLTVFKSTDEGATYPKKVVLDPGLSAQTSLQFINGKLYVLYEQADREENSLTNTALYELIGDMKILLPSRFIFREVEV